MSKWTHCICQACWNAAMGSRLAYSLVGAEAELCCYCGQPTKSGIFKRDDPTTVPCHGVHPAEAEPLNEAIGGTDPD